VFGAIEGRAAAAIGDIELRLAPLAETGRASPPETENISPEEGSQGTGFRIEEDTIGFEEEVDRHVPERLLRALGQSFR